jgi:hypothetical protein
MSTDILSVPLLRWWRSPRDVVVLLWALESLISALTLFYVVRFVDGSPVTSVVPRSDAAAVFDLYAGVRIVEGWRIAVPLCVAVLCTGLSTDRSRITQVLHALAGVAAVHAIAVEILAIVHFRTGWFGYASNSDLIYRPERGWPWLGLLWFLSLVLMVLLAVINARTIGLRLISLAPVLLALVVMVRARLRDDEFSGGIELFGESRFPLFASFVLAVATLALVYVAISKRKPSGSLNVISVLSVVGALLLV